jgi:hypothetical protein
MPYSTYANETMHARDGISVYPSSIRTVSGHQFCFCKACVCARCIYNMQSSQHSNLSQMPTRTDQFKFSREILAPSGDCFFSSVDFRVRSWLNRAEDWLHPHTLHLKYVCMHVCMYASGTRKATCMHIRIYVRMYKDIVV